MLILGEAVCELREGMYGNSLYFPHNFAINLKTALKKIKSIFLKHQTLKDPQSRGLMRPSPAFLLTLTSQESIICNDLPYVF